MHIVLYIIVYMILGITTATTIRYIQSHDNQWDDSMVLGFVVFTWPGFAIVGAFIGLGMLFIPVIKTLGVLVKKINLRGK